MKFSMQNPIALSLNFGSQFKTLDVSLYFTSVPLSDKIDFHREVGEMLYNDLNRNEMTISKVKKLLEKVVTRLKWERDNSRSIHI